MRKAGIAGFILVAGLATIRGHAQDGVNVFTATLAGEHEVPLVSSGAEGSFRAEIDDVARQVHYELSYAGFTTAVRQSHIHIAQPFASGSIMVWLCDSATNPAPAPVDVPSCPQGEGTVTGTISAADVGTGSSAQGVSAGEFEEFVAAIRTGNAYANVHSTQSQGGEIRGQLKPGAGPK
jgi:hypothetical protein